MSPNPEPSAAGHPGTYTPGYVNAKRLMLLGSLAALVFGLTELWTPLRLVAFGARATAEAVRVVKVRPGAADLILTDEIAVQRQWEARDRRFVFWNEFRFHTAKGETVEVRAAVGSQLKPIYPLTDEDGLPTTEIVCYDRGQPERVVFPFVISTWLAPAMVTFIGALGAVIAGTLLYWARRPIELPNIEAASSGSAP